MVTIVRGGGRKTAMTPSILHLHKACNIIIVWIAGPKVKMIDYLRNKSWKPECVVGFNMGWRILVFHPEPESF
jgi:hypothetical protein